MDEKDIQDMMESLRSSLEAGGGALDDMIEGLREVGATSEDVAEMLADLRKEGVAESRQTAAYTRNLERLNQELKPAPDIMDKFNKGIELTDREIRQLAAQVKNQKKKQEEAIAGLSKSFLNFGKNITANNSSIGGLGSTIGGAVEDIGEGLSNLGGTAKIAGKAVEAVGYIFTQASKQLEELRNNFESISTVGAAASDGMSGLIRQYTNAGMSLNSYTQVVKQNSEAMVAFRGTVTSSVEDFAKVTGNLTQGTNQDLRNLGFTTDEIAETTAAYIAQQTRMGRAQKMTVDELTLGSKQYAMELDLLSKATGASRDQLKADQDKILLDSQVRSKIDELNAQGKHAEAEAVRKLIATVHESAPAYEDAFKEMIATGGNVFDRSSKLFFAAGQSADLSKSFKNFNSGLISGEDLLHQVGSMINKTLPTWKDLAKYAPDSIDKMMGTYGEAADAAQKFMAIDLKSAEAEEQRQKLAADAQTAAMAKTRQAQEDFDRQLKRLYAEILPATGTVIEFFAVSLDHAINNVVGFVDTIEKTWNVLKNVAGWIDTKLTATFGDFYTGFKTFYTGITDIIVGLNKLNPLVLLFSDNWSAGIDQVKQGFEELFGGLASAGNFIIDTVDKLFGVDLRAAFDTVLDQFAAFQKMMGTILSPITKGLTQAVQKMQDFLTDILTKTWDMVVTKIGDVLGIDVKGMLSTASKAMSGFTDTIASAASDLSNVAKTAWAEGGISGGTAAGGERIAPKYGPESGPPSKGLTGNAATTQAMQFFMSKGWSKEQAAGLVGNLQQESGNFAADVVSGRRRGDSGKAVGIAQWHADRQQLFQQRYGKSLAGSSLEEQLDFVNYELTQGTERKAGAILKQARSAQEAGSLVDKYYERSAGTERSQRMANAAKLAGAAIDQPSVLLSTNLPNINPVQPTPVGARADLNQARSAQTRVAGAANTMTVLPQTTPAPAGAMGTYPNTGASEVPGAATSAGTPGGHFGPMAAAMPIDTLALTQNGQTNLTAPKNQTPSISAEPNQPQATETTATAPTPDQALKFAEQTMRYLQELNSKTDNMIQLLKDGNKNTKDIKSNQAA